MKKRLVIAEKPSVARDIARVLGCRQKGSSFMEGEKYIVTWALGHLVTLADPEQYGNQYKQWSMDTLPMMPEQWKLVVIGKTSKQYQAVKKLIFRNDVSDIIIATDAGREGELVARWILKKAGSQKPVQRLWISSVTDKAIREGFAHLKPGREYENLYHAAVARAEADWLVGINATRALTCKYNAQLSCGRVQTPTLAMIAKREDEIRTFRPKKFYGIKAAAQGMTFTWKDKKSGSGQSFDREKIEKIKKTVQDAPLLIGKISKKPKKTYAPSLYNLTDLQTDANKRFGFSAKQTLNLMQSLYEHHKVLTYPRTDSRFLSSDMADTIKERLKAVSVGPYKQWTAKLMTKKVSGSASFINDSKVTDHHAIIPTEQPVFLTDMSFDERKIYDLVVKRFLAVLSPACEYEQTFLSGTIQGETFEAKGTVMVKAGWKDIYQEEESTGEALPSEKLKTLREGSRITVDSIKITEGTTNPPARYTEGTLIAKMEKQGLGTVATRADIIEKLFSSFLLEKNGNDVVITAKAKQLLELVPEDLRKAELTAEWERRLTAIAEGREDDRKFMGEISGYTRQIIEEIKHAEGTFRHENLTRHKCPECGKFMLKVKGKHGTFLVCQDRECGFRKTLSRTSNARCPVCHKKMEMVGEGEGQKFVCVCGHKEKLSAFKERKKKEGAGVSKKEVSRYLKKQQKEAEQPINNAFADAFAKLKL
ncbi:DNA topoisomerase III [Anaerostipes sp.]|uniref:DNA topoisomerase III n=1 Tax=Anaerostipes sp. TaxID=1872530 RepID=UPI0025C1DBE7|nr:DNA topoisomerase III [Anaerostipes sp.]MBS7009776.1 DNA topoisomerase III [Anaerostipes sp.]